MYKISPKKPCDCLTMVEHAKTVDVSELEEFHIRNSFQKDP